MIIPIFANNDKTVGTAAVQRTEDGDFSVEFYLKPEFKLGEDVRQTLERTLKGIAASKRG